MSQIHPSVCPCTRPAIHPAFPACPALHCAEYASVWKPWLLTCRNLPEGQNWTRTPSPKSWLLPFILLTLFHPKHPPPGSAFTNMIMLPSCLHSLHCFLSDLRRIVGLLRVEYLVKIQSAYLVNLFFLSLTWACEATKSFSVPRFCPFGRSFHFPLLFLSLATSY